MTVSTLRDALDDRVNQVFAGKCVRKDLVRAVKVGVMSRCSFWNIYLGSTAHLLTQARLSWS